MLLIDVKPFLYLTIGLRMIYSYSYGFSSIALYVLFEFTVPVSFLICFVSSMEVDVRMYIWISLCEIGLKHYYDPL